MAMAKMRTAVPRHCCGLHLHVLCWWLTSSDFYEPGAIMLEEEAHVIAGLLVGLNVIDCNMGIKDEDLDKPVMLFVIFETNL